MYKAILIILVLTFPFIVNAQTLLKWRQIQPISATVEATNPTGNDMLLIENAVTGLREYVKVSNLLDNYLSKTENDSTGTNVTTLFGGVIEGQENSTARVQVNGLFRTGPIYLHHGAVPTYESKLLNNNGGSLEWNNWEVWNYGNSNRSAFDWNAKDIFAAGTVTHADGVLESESATVGQLPEIAYGNSYLFPYMDLNGTGFTYDPSIKYDHTVSGLTTTNLGVGVIKAINGIEVASTQASEFSTYFKIRSQLYFYPQTVNPSYSSYGSMWYNSTYERFVGNTQGGVKKFAMEGDAASSVTLQNITDNNNTTTHTLEHADGVSDGESATVGQLHSLVIDTTKILDLKKFVENNSVGGDLQTTTDLGATTTNLLTIDKLEESANKAKHKVVFNDGTGVQFRHQIYYWNGSAWGGTNGFGIGTGALQHNSGIHPNAFGNYTMQNNTGALSSGFGNYTLQNATGSYASAFGYSALRYNAGINNTALGAFTSSANTFTFINTTALGYNAQPVASNQVKLGDNNITNVLTTGTVTHADGVLDNESATVGQLLSLGGSGKLAFVNGTETDLTYSSYLTFSGTTLAARNVQSEILYNLLGEETARLTHAGSGSPIFQVSGALKFVGHASMSTAPGFMYFNTTADRWTGTTTNDGSKYFLMEGDLPDETLQSVMLRGNTTSSNIYINSSGTASLNITGAGLHSDNAVINMESESDVRARGIRYTNTNTNEAEWFSGLFYQSEKWGLGYDAGGGQSEYTANRIFYVSNSGHGYLAGTLTHEDGVLDNESATVGQLPDMTGYVPYIGATADLNFNGTHSLVNASTVQADNFIKILNGAAPTLIIGDAYGKWTSPSSMSLGSQGTQIKFVKTDALSATKEVRFDFASLGSTTRVYTLPDKDGTLALLSDISGNTEARAVESGNITVLSTDYTIVYNGLSAIDIFLPASPIEGKIYVFVNRSPSNDILIRNSDDTADIYISTISAGTSRYIDSQTSVSIQYIGTTWYQIH